MSNDYDDKNNENNHSKVIHKVKNKSSTTQAPLYRLLTKKNFRERI